MKQIKDDYKKTGHLHHAYGLCGEREKIKDELFSFLEEEVRFPVKANPDFWQGEFNIFKINDSRVLSEIHKNKAVKFKQKVFVILTNFITKDAQNSLLKIFEEPTAETIFFLIMPTMTNLIPTLKSRMIFNQEEKILVKNKNSSTETYQASEFISGSIGVRLDLIAKILKDIKNEKSTKVEVISFLKDLEKVSPNLLATEDIERAIDYLNDESPSVRVILEHLAVTL